jgi:hypothetical protein
MNDVHELVKRRRQDNVLPGGERASHAIEICPRQNGRKSIFANRSLNFLRVSADLISAGSLFHREHTLFPNQYFLISVREKFMYKSCGLYWFKLCFSIPDGRHDCRPLINLKLSIRSIFKRLSSSDSKFKNFNLCE